MYWQISVPDLCLHFLVQYYNGWLEGAIYEKQFKNHDFYCLLTLNYDGITMQLEFNSMQIAIHLGTFSNGYISTPVWGGHEGCKLALDSRLYALQMRINKTIKMINNTAHIPKAIKVGKFEWWRGSFKDLMIDRSMGATEGNPISAVTAS